MQQRYPNPKLNVQVYEEATEWLIEFRTGQPDAQARQRLDDWLRASPDHVRAYLEVNAIWQNTAQHDPQRQVSAEEHIARALAEDNVVALNSAPPRRPEATASDNADSRGSERAAITTRRWAIAASAAFLCIAVGTLAWWHFLQAPSYSTQTGEQRSIALEDGSTMLLNSRSRVRVSYSEHERSIELLAGQVLFQVAKDTQRPFVVDSDDVRVRALGTQFDVYQKPGGTVVTVVEGRVAVSKVQPSQRTGVAPSLPSPEPPAAIAVSTGEQITASEITLSRPRQIDLATATAWTQRRLVFDAVPLREVAAEFNRYNSRPMVLDGAGLENLAIIGVFSSTDPASLLRFLRTQPGVDVVEEDDRILITHRP